MTPILYVDVDGTLAYGDKANWPLVQAVRIFLAANDDYDLIVWSGAGEEHARSWASRCFGGGGFVATVKPKDFTDLEPGDVVVDDMRLPFALTPRQFIAQVNEGDVQTDKIAPPGMAAGPDAWPYDYGELVQANDRMKVPA